ncbi:hypothetical protein KQH90_08915 [Anaerosalibacter bizertensis]|uniref:hypothetical protein n=1 Tax=Anaerosalibacter bizertensis TaxID=932217 RepID=UPI00175FFEE1|nr:hypothetical protein [Anaerosalibacter bizertensis]MBU5294154.1 hypothetical protein [Anaerosalibacter bizertensis]HHV25823.1 hypothetical protein [Tissierellia bacterium]
MDLFKDLFFINSTTSKKALRSFSKNWTIVFTGFAYTLLNIVIFNLINLLFRGVLGILAGFAAAIVTSSLISNYLYLLYNIIKYDNFTFEDFKEGFSHFLWKVYGVFFIAWLLSFFFGGLGDLFSESVTRINMIINILIIIIFNPLPEIIYQKVLSPWESITYSFNFMKENWFNWLLPNAIFFFIIYKFTGNMLTNIFATHLSYNFDISLIGILKYLIGQVLFSFIMIYRGFLFEILSTSTRRKRSYMKKFYD